MPASHGGKRPANQNPEVMLVTSGSGRGKRLADVARSCGRYMYDGLILTGQTGMLIWYPPNSETKQQHAVAGTTPNPIPSPMFSPVEVVPRVFAPVPRFAED